MTNIFQKRWNHQPDQLTSLWFKYVQITICTGKSQTHFLRAILNCCVSHYQRVDFASTQLYPVPGVDFWSSLRQAANSPRDMGLLSAAETLRDVTEFPKCAIPWHPGNVFRRSPCSLVKHMKNWFHFTYWVTMIERFFEHTICSIWCITLPHQILTTQNLMSQGAKV